MKKGNGKIFFYPFITDLQWLHKHMHITPYIVMDSITLRNGTTSFKIASDTTQINGLAQ